MKLARSLPIHYFLIFKKSISVAALPADWKLAEVTAVHKKGSKSDR